MVSDKPSNSKDLFLPLWIVFCFLLAAETKTSSNTPTCLLYDFIYVFLFIFSRAHFIISTVHSSRKYHPGGASDNTAAAITDSV